MLFSTLPLVRLFSITVVYSPVSFPCPDLQGTPGEHSFPS